MTAIYASSRNPDPPTSIYPRRESCDPAYSVPEQKLRSAIYIPKTFTYGNKTPVVLFPGSGSTGYMTFAGSFIPLLTNVTWADPIWVNVPMMLLDDAQSNSEYIAYALNYIAAITNRNVSLIAWSQGNLNAQWANKYWPSTRKITSNNIALSADYKGTTLAALVDATGLTKTPAFIQQESKSRFLRTLRSSGGDSAYVPTTTIYSSNLDEIVVPQKGKQASAYLKDARRVGVTNVEVQAVCHDKPAGGFYTHESILGNPLAFALAKDAIIKGGPAQLKRLNLSKICQRKLTAGLGDDDAKITEMAILKIAEAVLKYSPKAQSEPPIRSYARQGYSQC